MVYVCVFCVLAQARRSGLWHIMKPFQYCHHHGYEFALKWDGDIILKSPVRPAEGLWVRVPLSARAHVKHSCILA